MVPTSSVACLQFWYHMLGDGIGTLRVWVNQGIPGTHNIDASSKEYVVWSLTADQGSNWLNAQVSHDRHLWCALKLNNRTKANQHRCLCCLTRSLVSDFVKSTLQKSPLLLYMERGTVVHLDGSLFILIFSYGLRYLKIPP